MMLVDAHTHLDHFDTALLPEVLAEIESLKMVTLANSMDLPSYQQANALAKRFPLVVPGLGVHPWQAGDWAERLEEIRPFLATAPFYGEIGLDFHWVEDRNGDDLQRKVLHFFLEAARIHNKLINLHTKGAEAEICELLMEYKIDKAIIHWYSGPPEPFEQLVARGYAFSIGVEVLSSSLIQSFAKRLPLPQLLTETDGPSGLEWLTGETGRPRHITAVLEKIAELRGLEVEGVQTAVWENMKRLLGKKQSYW